MKRFFFITSILCLTLFAPFRLFGQNHPTANSTFRVKYSVKEADIQWKINDYFTAISGLTQGDDGYSFKGAMRDFAGIRYWSDNNPTKSTFDVAFTIRCKFKGRKVSLDYFIDSVTERVTICDIQQSTFVRQIGVSQLPEETVEDFTQIAYDYSNCIKDYLYNSIERLPKYPNPPFWYPVVYVYNNGHITYSRVLTSENGLTKEDIYRLFENYFTYTYMSGKNVIENKDPEHYSLLGKGIYSISYIVEKDRYTDFSLPHVISIECRDGRARVTISIDHADCIKANAEKKDAPLLNAERHILAQFEDMQKTLDKGNTSLETINNW